MREGHNDGKYEITSEGLVIRNITRDDRGAYKCKATQLDEEITDFQELIIELRVQRKYNLYLMLNMYKQSSH